MTMVEIEQKRRNSTYFVIRTVKRQNRPRRFHALVEIWRDRCTPVEPLSDEPPRDPNQSSVPPVIDYNWLMPREAKETHPMNIENFNSNKLFLETLLKRRDIVCIQEHWCYNFEKHNLEHFCNDRGFDCFLKCCDDADPLSPLLRPRGKGGTGILWRKAISRNIKVLPDGLYKICAVMCESGSHDPVCIINVYLPCRGYKDSDDRFLEGLNELREIIIKYAVNAHIILTHHCIGRSHLHEITDCNHS